MILVDEDVLNDPMLHATREMETDPTFVPCRDECCTVQALHREHEVKVGRGQRFKRCPMCNAEIIRIPRKRAYCSSPSCSWRIVNRPA
jgi:hypothetical protein